LLDFGYPDATSDSLIFNNWAKNLSPCGRGKKISELLSRLALKIVVGIRQGAALAGGIRLDYL